MTVADALATLRRHRLVPASLAREHDAALDRVEAEIARLQRHPDAWSQHAFDQQKARADAAEAEVARLRSERDLAEERATDYELRWARLRDGLRPIVREYDLWSEDANDGEFRLWDLDRLVAAIVAARALLAEDGAARPVPVESLLTDDDYEVLAEDGAA